MTRTLHVVVDIGCLECGESSEVVGVYTSVTDALRARADRIQAHGGDTEDRTYFTGGLHAVEAFKVEASIE